MKFRNFFIFRYLHKKEVQSVYLTMVELERAPYGELRLDTTWMKVNHTTLPTFYIKVMIGAAYFTEVRLVRL